MTPGYFLRPKADKDIDDIADALVERANLDVGLHFLDLSHKTFALLVTQPDMGWRCRISHSDLKEVRVFRVREPFDKYLIFYQHRPPQVEILRILHGAQDLEDLLRSQGAF